MTRLPAIGKRTAETIVAQLRGKVTEEALLADEGFDKPESPRPAGPSDIARDTIEGPNSPWVTAGREAERLVQQVDADSELETVEEALRAVFRRLNPA